MTAKVTYLGGLRNSCEHLASGDIFATDAPVDNNGLGQAFSPTDTVATGLASCMMTMMGIKANGLAVDLKGATAGVTKHMATEPRRISKIEVVLNLPSAISDKNRKILEHTANTCPVHFSLHPAIEKVITFHWDL
ncbi:OsmC family protein [Cellulophaga sp. E16_2]|uniref:OsmC family protein n=1 Tax=Cellulophaga algicola (strain DSM 14237 / IC166 / ACAM 630) TaxID=688270 RepID=E6XAJ8_CELAD|nr:MULTISPECIES: OsmC family protein [Cellulophaga]ADV49914.1 OsmC family protein [Cellulophaga algicola DSM 14237]MBO0592296.1 OsmC family protein [Cellulophaga sp. E16_2]